MPKITFINPDGSEVGVEVANGENAMRAAAANGLDGIVGDCGGALNCATCHVFVSKEFWDKLPDIDPLEDQMLDFTAATRRSNSRLSCQIIMSEELDGLILTIADPQL